MIEPASHVRPHDHHLWTTPDPESLEDEVRELLISLVRVMKPEVVVEIGSYIGIVAESIGHTLEVNGRGHLHSFEIDPVRAKLAAERVEGLPVTVHPISSTIADVGGFPEVDLLFIDGALEERAADFLRWRDRLAPWALAVIHDTLKYDPPRQDIFKLPDTEQVWFRTPRGVTLVQNVVRP